jgi:hypothetical protein
MDVERTGFCPAPKRLRWRRRSLLAVAAATPSGLTRRLVLHSPPPWTFTRRARLRLRVKSSGPYCLPDPHDVRLGLQRNCRSRSVFQGLTTHASEIPEYRWLRANRRARAEILRSLDSCRVVSGLDPRGRSHRFIEENRAHQPITRHQEPAADNRCAFRHSP